MATMPKRRKDKYNPYTLNYNEVKNTYLVSFNDNKNINHTVEVSQKIYEAFNNFELEDLSQMNKYDRHIEHSEIYDSKLNERSINTNISLEDTVEHNIIAQEIKEAINLLSDVQKRRLKMYYFDNLKLREIAEKEHCSIMSVKESIDTAIKNIQKKLKL